MKQWICKGLLFCFLLSLLSCASTMSMFIEVEKPATVTLPVTAQNVVIVNNTLPQPVGYGLSAPSEKNQGKDSTHIQKLNAENYLKRLNTASWRVATEAFKYLDDSKFFSDVSLYKKALREDDEWLSVIPVRKELREDFFENENYDLLISIDRILFKSNLESDKVELGRMEALLTFSAYLRDKDNPIVHQSIRDTVKAYYSDIYFENGIPWISSVELNSEMIFQSSANLGEKLGAFFAPNWESAERIYFIKNPVDAAQKTGYINKGKWAEAQFTWIDEFESAKKVADKAKAATNVALACEMNDEFTVAKEWAEKAKTFFQDASSKKYAKEINYLNEYIKVLQERERNNAKLNEQYGISEKR